MFRNFKLPFLLIGTLALAACVSNTVKKEEFGEFKNVPMSEAEIMPSEAELSNERIKTIILAADDGSDELARSAHVGSALSRTVAALVSAGSLEVVDNSLDPKLAEALRIAESKGASDYSGPKLADYAIKPIVTHTNYTAAYTQPSSYTDPKTKKVTQIAGGWGHKAEMRGTVRIYKLPSLKLVENVNISGYSSLNNGLGSSQTFAVALVNKAALSAVDTFKADIMKVFAAKGYISAKRSNGKKTIFLVNMGLQSGLLPGSTVQIFNARKEDTANLKGEFDIEEILVAECTVTENVTAKQAWVAINNEDLSKKIMRGDIVKVLHKDDLGSSIKKLIPL
jgi:hypothetical protein